jgi:hypothetical protein
MTNLEKKLFSKGTIYAGSLGADPKTHFEVSIPFSGEIELTEPLQTVENMQKVYNWFIREQEGSVELKDWEYDLIRLQIADGFTVFQNSPVLKQLKTLGYFKDIDGNQPLVDIVLTANIISSENRE